MTGPAKFAWNITLWMALMVLPLMAHAAAPRDAVKNMPTFSHTSTFDIVSEDGLNSHTYTETYRDIWRIDWGTPKIDFSSGAWTKFDIHYETTLTDALNRINGISSDSRYEYLSGLLRFNSTRDFESSFKLEQTDTFSGQFPARQPRSWNSKTNKSAFAAWSHNGFPKFSAGYKVNNTYNYLGSNQNNGSEFAETQFQSEYRWLTNEEWQSAMILRQMTRSNTFLPEHGGSNRDKTVYDAQRMMKFPHFGALSLGFRHEEQSKDSTAGSYATNYNTNYSLGLQGGVRDMPVNYNYRYQAMYSGNSNSQGNQRMLRQLNLTFNPPVPVGKSAGMSYKFNIDESTFPNNEKTTSEQELSWNFSSNPRTKTTFNYTLREVTDRLASQQTEDRETLGANIRYNIPGGRGAVTGSINEEVFLIPSSGERNIVDSLTLRSMFNLGPGTSLDLMFDQRKDANGSGLLEGLRGKEAFISQVRYKTSGHGLSTEAIYKQHHYKLDQSDNATTQETIKLIFSYQTEAQWNYRLTVTSNAKSVDSLASTGYDYSTDDTIHAEVAYSF